MCMCVSYLKSRVIILKNRFEHVQQLYLHSRKRQTTAEIIELLDLNINSSVISRDFTDQREIKKKNQEQCPKALKRETEQSLSLLTPFLFLI